jgi:hypothetical protein
MLGRLIMLDWVFDKTCANKWAAVDWFRILVGMGFVGRRNKNGELNCLL